MICLLHKLGFYGLELFYAEIVLGYRIKPFHFSIDDIIDNTILRNTVMKSEKYEYVDIKGNKHDIKCQ